MVTRGSFKLRVTGFQLQGGFSATWQGTLQRATASVLRGDATIAVYVAQGANRNRLTQPAVDNGNVGSGNRAILVDIANRKDWCTAIQDQLQIGYRRRNLQHIGFDIALLCVARRRATLFFSTYFVVA